MSSPKSGETAKASWQCPPADVDWHSFSFRIVCLFVIVFTKKVARYLWWQMPEY